MTTTHTSVPELILSPGERVVLSQRASPWIIILRPAVWHLMMLLVLAAAWAASRTILAELWGLILGLWMLAVLTRLVWDTLDWFCRRHILTDQRLLRASGVIRRSMADLPLGNSQYLAVDRSLRQRFVGVGTIAAGTSGLALPEVVWQYVPSPDVVLETIRETIQKSARAGTARGQAPKHGNVTVIGLVGGIGSGKSTVASELAARGFLVIDSDRAAREILSRVEIRDELVRWWGLGVLNASGEIDRGKVASIVFSDPAERTRLESLIHPIIKRQRDEVIARTAAAGGGTVVIDAPLLFEAGVDRECDAVVFVDAPLPVRRQRVAARGWDEQELARREKSQLPLDEKRARSNHVIVNDADRQTLSQRVEELAHMLAATTGGGH